MFSKSFDDLSYEDLVSLKHQQIPESLILDYKESLDLTSDQAKRELVKDVSAFANTQGGLLLYGAKEDRRKKYNLTRRNDDTDYFDLYALSSFIDHLVKKRGIKSS
ncbi:MAG: AlbA family DNA-binding domain-containing protein [Candidatus Ranarchaeia archaeon]